MNKQAAKSPRTRARVARTTADRAGAAPAAGRAGSADSGRCEKADGDKLATVAALWAEYDALTKAEWHCDRATALRSQIRRLLGGTRCPTT